LTQSEMETGLSEMKNFGWVKFEYWRMK